MGRLIKLTGATVTNISDSNKEYESSKNVFKTPNPTSTKNTLNIKLRIIYTNNNSIAQNTFDYLMKVKSNDLPPNRRQLNYTSLDINNEEEILNEWFKNRRQHNNYK